MTSHFDIKKIIHRLVETYKEYYYPHHACSMFLLPDGNLIGMPYILAHNSMIKHVVGLDLTHLTTKQIIKDAGLISLTVNCDELFIDSSDSLTPNQSQTLKNLRDYGKYKNVID